MNSSSSTANRRNIKLILAYDGSAYKGWQKTRMGQSVEEILQWSITTILRIPITLQAASRTDAGVHAQGQVVNFFIPKEAIDLQNLVFKLNRLLPKDICVIEGSEVDISFHPTLCSIGKEYHYYVCCKPVQLPQHRLYSWHCHYPIELNAMKEAAKMMLGRHDFASFCNRQVNRLYHDFYREISGIDITEIEVGRLRFDIKGHSFLYKMVRNIVGTLIYIGRGKISPLELTSIMNAKDRCQAGITAPAHGLTLHKVYY